MRFFDLKFTFGIENTATQILYFAGDIFVGLSDEEILNSHIRTPNVSKIQKLSEFRSRFINGYLNSVFNHDDFCKLDAVERDQMMLQIAHKLVVYEKKAAESSLTRPQFSTTEMEFDPSYFERIERHNLMTDMLTIGRSFGVSNDEKYKDEDYSESSNSEDTVIHKVPTLLDIGITKPGIERTATKILYSVAFLFPFASTGKVTAVAKIDAIRQQLIEILQRSIDYDKYTKLPEKNRDKIRQAIAEKLYALAQLPYFTDEDVFIYEKHPSRKSWIGTQEYRYTAYAIRKDAGMVIFDPLLIKNFESELEFAIKQIANNYTILKSVNDPALQNQALVLHVMTDVIKRLFFMQDLVYKIPFGTDAIVELNLDLATQSGHALKLLQFKCKELETILINLNEYYKNNFSEGDKTTLTKITNPLFRLFNCDGIGAEEGLLKGYIRNIFKWFDENAKILLENMIDRNKILNVELQTLDYKYEEFFKIITLGIKQPSPEKHSSSKGVSSSSVKQESPYNDNESLFFK